MLNTDNHDPVIIEAHSTGQAHSKCGYIYDEIIF